MSSSERLTAFFLFSLDSGTIGFDAITIGNHSRASSDTIQARGNRQESNSIAIEEKAEANLLVLTRISVVAIVLALAETELAMFFFEWHKMNATIKKMIESCI